MGGPNKFQGNLLSPFCLPFVSLREVPHNGVFLLSPFQTTPSPRETGATRELDRSPFIKKDREGHLRLTEPFEGRQDASGLLKRSPLCNHLKHVALSTPKYSWKPPNRQVAMFRWF